MTLNDRSSTLALLETRRSGRPREMVAPGPSEAELARILAIAARTPDHGKLFPWRFVTVAASQRPALADLLARALAEHDPQATPAHFAKAAEFAHQAPVARRPRVGADRRITRSRCGNSNCRRARRR